ncbi:MAG: glycosyltransferase family 2 protein [Verrucomicrobia bacterium]|nr:MAG: glycosyltransferase family 2 protein [Verrucomicrobiota bacterium]
MRVSREKRPLVSVLLPAYNAETTIARAIDSIRSQSFSEWELILADDGSTDRTAEIASTAARLDARIKVHRFEQRGLVPTLNDAIELARGSTLARMDADDESAPDRLGLQVAYLEKHRQTGMVASQVRFGGDRASAPGYAEYVDWTNTVLSAEEISMNRFIESPIAHPSVMFRRETLVRYGGYRDTDWPEDYELWLRWLDAGVRIEKLPEPLVTWNDPPDRLSRRHPRYRTEAFYACKCHYLAKWISKTVEPDRPIILWGAGRITRKRFHTLEESGVTLSGYIDINPRKIGLKIGGLPVHDIAAIPEDRGWFIVAGVGNRGARESIRRELEQRGYREGADYVLAA